MADGVDFQGTTPSYPPTDLKVSSDKTVGGYDIQRVKLAVSGDGLETHIPADATAGLKVDLGADNDVTVTGTVGATQSGTWDVRNVSGTVSLPTGAATLAEQQTQTTALGATNETAPASDTATAGINGRLQRIAQRLTSIIALLPSSLGAGGGLKVDGSGTALPVSGTVTANAGTGPFPVSDNAGSLTIDAPVGTPVFVRLSDGVSAITALPITDNSGSLTVDNAGTFAVQAAQSGTWNIANVSGTVSLPTGASTAAKQPALGTAGTPSADVITVQGVTSMTALKVDGSAVTQPVSGTVTANLAAGTNAIGKLSANSGVTIGAVELAAAQTLATVTTVGAVTSITNALPAGTNAIGKLAANSGVDIGDVDVLSVVPGSGATNLGKATDAVAGASDVGVAPMLVRDDVLTAITPADGDWAPARVDKVGAQWGRKRNAGTGTLTNVSSSATTASLLASNSDRLGVIAVNDSTATQYIKYGATASPTSYTYQIPPGATWEMPEPIYTGALDYISAAASGTIRVTELS